MSLKKAQDLVEAGIITEPGNAETFKTGDWRTFVPVFYPENCIQCLFCWIYCPDSSIKVDLSGQKPQVVGIELDHCKGCGICAQECPPAAKGKAALVMIREEK